MKAPRKVAQKRGFSPREAVGYLLIAGAVWLGWEVLKAPMVQRGPASLAVRLAAASPEVLGRAAEAELLAQRTENARFLADKSLSGAPFNVRALRVRGLAEAQLGDVNRADEMLTLSGNWSLRDDPSHAWLIEHRLRRGDYQSAFAHADTLVRRRADLFPSIFKLFSVAAVEDPRALSVLVRQLTANPPWRGAFIEYLHDSDDGAPIVGALAIALQATDAPFTDYELQRLYERWLVAGRFAGIREMRARLNRPPANDLLQNGDFAVDPDDQAYPFGWRLEVGPGMAGSVLEDDLRVGNPAYRLEYDGFSSGVFLRQLLLLAPGSYTLAGRQRAETPRDDPGLEWRLACADGGDEIVISRLGTSGAETEWRPFSAEFQVPARNCTVQWLLLVSRPGDRRTSIAVWLDDIALRRSSGPQAANGAASS